MTLATFCAVDQYNIHANKTISLFG